MDSLYNNFDKFIHTDWITTALGIVVILAITALVSRICVILLRRILKRGSLLPQSSIFVNVIRVCIWLIGISFMLSVCFNINVSAIITALGVGGIAISLGFQDTISNLIGGLQVSLSRIVEPGDNIQLGANGVNGIVRDVTWRHTTIDNPDGTTVIIPNSIINTTALLKLTDPENVSIPIVATNNEQRLTTVAHRIEDAAQKALTRVSKLRKDPSVAFTEVTADGFKGTLSFTLADASKVKPARDSVIRAIAPYVHARAEEENI
ncbi:mechanosensitive ion channel family protein [Adlercreutzia sp. ZJ154]|uniref:mechanosensitive ion channel family protein n=1 Tax=Adlercreutzia sp. ZJ154 TaxID=2709790 RepID=UPI0013ED19DC|nr:mechanosensitive ion channel family protein [Adlercreutzia sp. ZJ154]